MKFSLEDLAKVAGSIIPLENLGEGEFVRIQTIPGWHGGMRREDFELLQEIYKELGNPAVQARGIGMITISNSFASKQNSQPEPKFKEGDKVMLKKDLSEDAKEYYFVYEFNMGTPYTVVRIEKNGKGREDIRGINYQTNTRFWILEQDLEKWEPEPQKKEIRAISIDDLFQELGKMFGGR